LGNDKLSPYKGYINAGFIAAAAIFFFFKGDYFTGILAGIIAWFSWQSRFYFNRENTWIECVVLTGMVVVFLGVAANIPGALKPTILISNLSVPFLLIASILWFYPRIYSQFRQGNVQQTLLPIKQRELYSDGLVVLIFVFLILKSAWVVDDAFITFRTIDNFIHGLGLVWNTGDRVQAYTHPLWLFVIAVAYFVTHEAYYTCIVFGLVCTVIAVILAKRISETAGTGHYSWLLGISLLSFSKAFIDYSTSGLENPLIYFLMAMFFFFYFRPVQTSKTIFLLSVITALGTLTRMDAFLFFAIPLCHAMWTAYAAEGRKVFGLFLKGFIPFFVWEAFSVFYYGFPFPNTAYAKLNTGISTLLLIQQGMKYLVHSLRIDPVTLTMITAGLIIAFIQRKPKPRMLALGVLCYLLYVISIGGDSMSGRFLAAPFFGMVLVMMYSITLTPRSSAWMIIPMLGLMLISPANPWRADAFYDRTRTAIDAVNDIDDTRGGYYQSTGLFRASATQNHVGIARGQELKEQDVPVFVYSIIGYLGYYAGPRVYIVDIWALADPLLARLPCAAWGWRIGHFMRALPTGYIETIQNHRLEFKDENLALYYEKLKIITQGELFGFERLKTIVLMNLGFYEKYIDQKFYKNSVPEQAVRNLVPAVEFLIPAKDRCPYADLVNQGMVAAQLDDWNRATGLWQNAKQLNPARVEAVANLGVYYERIGNSDAALEAYKVVAEKIGLPWSQYCEQLKVNLISENNLPTPVIPKKNSAPQSETKRILAMAQDKSAYAELNNLGVKALMQRQVEDARRIWSQAEALDPSRPEAKANLGVWNEHAGNFPLALEEYKFAARKLGEPWDRYYNQVKERIKRNGPNNH
jgi:arabinofuranosyltransferase